VRPGAADAARRLEALTGLRFVAALLVVVHHFGRGPAADLGPAAARVAGYGYVGVSFFFVLSGFILAYVYGREGGVVGAAARRAFYGARFARVYPLYAFALLLAAPGFAARVLAEAAPDAQAAVGAATAVTAPLLLQAWTPWTALLWNAPGWSLSVEACLYLLTPALLAVAARRSGRGLAVGGAGLWALGLALPALYLARFGTAEPAAGSAAGLWLHALLYAPPAHVPQFALGLVAGVAYVRHRAPRRLGGAAAALLAALALGLALVPGVPQPLLNNGLVAPAFAALLVLLAPGDAVYLLQKPVYQAVYNAAEASGVDAPQASTPFFLGYVALLVGVAVAANRWLEVPARRWLRGRFAGGPR
jgi:peptidoglycan/LPS O-acetylase OafA/YrhL